MQKFKSPKRNPLVIELCKYILPIWLKNKEHLSIKVIGSETNLAKFSKCKRALVLLNHPDRQDPFVVSQLAKQMHEDFNCIVARECFDWDGGWRGWLFQSLGCYSVARGKPDFHSVATTKKLLREAHRKLIVFPEAEITADDNKVHDLHNAIFHIALSVQAEISAATTITLEEPVFIIPAAIKFSLDSELDVAVSNTLKAIERKLGLKHGIDQNSYSRIAAVVNAYLTRVIDAYGFQKPEGTAGRLAEFAATEILRKIARTNNNNNNTDSTGEISAIERLYATRNQLPGNPSKLMSVAAIPNSFHCAGFQKPSLSSDLERVERLLIMQRMLEHSSSEIQSCRILDFIECELFGVITAKGWQSCVVEIGEPIAVSNFLHLFAESKENGVECLSQHFKEKLQAMLNSTSLTMPASSII